MRKWLSAAILVLVLAGAGGVAGIIWHYGRDLPDYRQLADYRTMTSANIDQFIATLESAEVI